MTDQRPKEPRHCTCHPDDRPPVCQHRYAASECQQAYRTSKEQLAITELVAECRLLVSWVDELMNDFSCDEHREDGTYDAWQEDRARVQRILSDLSHPREVVQDEYDNGRDAR